MANNKNSKEIKDINSRLMDYVVVKNLNPTIFALTVNKDKVIIFKGQETKTMTVQELLSVAGSTKAFSGIDGSGKSAPLYIDDLGVRLHLGYETENGEGQDILDEKKILQILDYDFKKLKEVAKETFNDIPKKALLEKVILSNDEIEARKIKFLEKELGLQINYPEKEDE